MTTPSLHSVRHEFASTISRLGLTSLATSMLAMLYKLAMPRLLGTTALADFYFSETFPYLFFALVPFGIGNYIARNLAGNLPLAKRSLTSILGFEAIAGSVAYGLLIITIIYRNPMESQAVGVLAMMGVACLASIFQQRILRPTFIALDAAGFVSRLELSFRSSLTVSILISLAIQPNIKIIALLYAIFESGAVGLYVWSCWQRGWLSEAFQFRTVLQILKASLPFTAVTVMLAINGNTDSILFRWLTDAHETGLYAATNRLGLIALFGVSVIFSSILPMLGRVLHQSPEAYQGIFASVARLIGCGGLPLTTVFTLLSPDFSQIIFGAEYAAAWRALSLYGVYMLIVAMNMLLSSNLAIRARAPTYAGAIGFSLALNLMSASIGIAVAYRYFGEGSAGTGRLLAGIASDLTSTLIFLYLGQTKLEQKKILKPFLLAVIPALAIASLQIMGLINAWLERGIIMILIPFYMYFTGLLQFRDVLFTVKTVKNLLARLPQKSPIVA